VPQEHSKLVVKFRKLTSFRRLLQLPIYLLMM